MISIFIKYGKKHFLPGICSSMLLCLIITTNVFCGRNTIPTNEFAVITRFPIKDIQNIPQNSSAIPFFPPAPDEKMLAELRKKSRDNYFSPWHRNILSFSKKDIVPDKEYLKGLFSENLLNVNDHDIEAILTNADFESYGKASAPGIIVEETDLRALPTESPAFEDPATAGNGYPFDMLQESRLPVCAPVMISHFSKDGAWVLVDTNESCWGWVKSDSVIIISKKDIKTIESMKTAVIIKDGKAVYNPKGKFSFYSKAGNWVPMISIIKESLIIKMPSIQNGQLIWTNCQISQSVASPEHLEFTEENVKTTIDSFIGKKYGWGTYLGNRDCSAMVHDFFALFGIWLPRNSKSQSLSFGKQINIEGKSDTEKKEMIVKEGIPFRTLIYRPGHIVIYAGSINEKVLIFHSVWGVKTVLDGKYGRNVIGRSVFTTIEYGNDVPFFDSKSGTFLKNATRMTIFP